MSLPLQVQLDLVQAASDAISICGMGLAIYVGIKAIQFMRRAIDGGPIDHYMGYTVIDDLVDRATQYQADRMSADMPSNARRDLSDAAKDVIWNQPFFGGDPAGLGRTRAEYTIRDAPLSDHDFDPDQSGPSDSFTTAYQARLTRDAGDRIAEAKGWDDRDHPW